MRFTEDTVEQAALQWLNDVGYGAVAGDAIAPGGPAAERESWTDVVLVGRLRAAIERLNPGIPEEAREDALRRILRPDLPSLVQNNRAFHKRLRDGVQVEYRRDDGSIAGDHVLLFAAGDSLNDFLAVNQFTAIEGGHKRRLDIVLFVNGLPLVVIELKNQSSEGATVDKAVSQLQTYKHELPGLFHYNELLVVSDGQRALIGSLTAGREWFKPWRTIEDETPIKGLSELEVVIRGALHPQRLLELISGFVLFEEDTDSERIDKILAGYHQFHAARQAIAATIDATRVQGNRRCGVVWHTQGSGKSLTMLFYSGLVIAHPAMNNPTLIVLTDRNDLDDQLFGQFHRCADILRQTPVQAENVDNLRELLQVGSGGVVFTTVQKFAEREGRFPLLSDRKNIVVMADEAHRSQYGFQAKRDKKTGEISYGFAQNIRDALPEASYIGFTGTPIELTDKNTRAVFGDYISVYDIRRAVDDKATVPIYYESRVIKLKLADQSMSTIDDDFEEVTEAEETTTKERLKTKWAALESMVGDDDRIKQVARDVVEHFETRCEALHGKGMIVCMSRRICVDLYNEIIKLRPQWHGAAGDADDACDPDRQTTGTAADGQTPLVGQDLENWQTPLDEDARVLVADPKPNGSLETGTPSTPDLSATPAPDDAGAVKIIMTGSAADPPEWQQHIRTKLRRKQLANSFKNPASSFRLVIVRDMWLTGFDAPPLHTLYLDKPMHGHGLMQAIARVNRVFGEKPGGLIVDYLGVGDSLRQALRTYTESGGTGQATINTADAVLALQKHYELCCDMLHGFDWSKFLTGGPGDNVSLPIAAQEHLLLIDDEVQQDGKKRTAKQRWLAHVSDLSKAFALCPTDPYAAEIRDDVAFFQIVATMFRKYSENGKSKSELDYAVRQLVSKAVVTTDDGVIDVFTAAGIEKPDISILSDEFLAEVRRLPYKNVAVELLKKLLGDEIKLRSPRNVVQARRFSELLQQTLNAYHNRAIATHEIIDELINVAKGLREAAARGENLGLNNDELAFYDALAQNNSAVETLGDDKLKVIATELIINVRKNVTIDWTARESARAKIRVMVRRILRRHGYPPDLQAEATKLVLEQAEALCQGWA